MQQRKLPTQWARRENPPLPPLHHSSFVLTTARLADRLLGAAGSAERGAFEASAVAALAAALERDAAAHGVLLHAPVAVALRALAERHGVPVPAAFGALDMAVLRPSVLRS